MKGVVTVLKGLSLFYGLILLLSSVGWAVFLCVADDLPALSTTPEHANSLRLMLLAVCLPVNGGIASILIWLGLSKQSRIAVADGVRCFLTEF